MRVILGSASPRRREIFARIADPFEVRPADLDETRRTDEAPEVYVERLAREKAAAIAALHPDALVVGADTTVAVGDEVLEKPLDARDACRMLARLSGCRHAVHTGVAVARAGRVETSFLTRSEVIFRDLSDAEIERYVDTGDPLDKAGGYAVQGGAGAFVRRIEGSVTNVIGLPLEETAEAVRAFGGPDGPGSSLDGVALRFRSLEGEIAARTVACGRAPGSVRLVTVVKGHPPEYALAAVAAGARDLGENYVQEARSKREFIAREIGKAHRSREAGPRWHLIGPLQRNKAALAARNFDLIHTVDRAPLARALAARVEEAREPLPVLVQVNVASDPAKAGVSPADLGILLDEIAGAEKLCPVGLMTIGRAGASPDEGKQTFEALRKLRDELRPRHPGLTELSMGMSADYHEAIEEGATLVRLGTAILGPRPIRHVEEKF